MNRRLKINRMMIGKRKQANKGVILSSFDSVCNIEANMTTNATSGTPSTIHMNPSERMLSARVHGFGR
jgi:hypothetical protein